MIHHKRLTYNLLAGLIAASLLAILQISHPLADFNNDRVSELVIGIPGEDPLYEGSYITSAGAFDVMYGALGVGFNDWMETMLWQGLYDVYGTPEAGDNMGNALAMGDFNGDGNWDLAVGVYQEDISGVTGAGGVQIFYGDGQTLRIDNDHMIYEGLGDIPGVLELYDHFGEVLAVGNFNYDAYDDLAIGVPYEDGSGAIDSGVVIVVFGSATGLTDAGSLMLRQGHDGLPNTEENGDIFGSALAVGDFDNDHYDDLVIGVPNEYLAPPDVPEPVGATGVVHVIYGDLLTLGPPFVGNDFLFEDSVSFDLCDNSNSLDYFGRSLATGDFNEGTFDDLAIGVNKMGEDLSLVYGGIHVVFGGLDGLRDDNDQCWDADNMDLTVSDSDLFAYSMTSCDFNGDKYSDLAIGSPGDSDIGISEHGSLAVVYGGSNGIVPSTAELFKQGLNGLKGARETGDVFGYAIAGGNFNGDGYCDLAVGVPFEDVDNPVVTDAGGVHILFGSEDGITTQGNQFWYQGSPGILDDPGENDYFGRALASIPFYNKWLYLPMIRR